MTDKGGVLITGASTGIGEACAKALAERGYHVFAGVRKGEDGERLRAEIPENLTPVILDVTKPDEVAAAVATVESGLGGAPLAGLFNNAGITVNYPLEFVPLEELRWQLEVNVVGQVGVTQAFLPLLRKSKGRIITTGSVGGFFVTPLLGPYCMSKFAMEAFSDTLRLELRPWGIKVIHLQPAAVATKIWEKGQRDGDVLLDNAPEGMMDLYGSLVNNVRKLATKMEKDAADPQVVVDAVLDAMESSRPKARYIMGKNAWPQKIISKLPTGMKDNMVARLVGLS